MYRQKTSAVTEVYTVPLHLYLMLKSNKNAWNTLKLQYVKGTTEAGMVTRALFHT